MKGNRTKYIHSMGLIMALMMVFTILVPVKANPSEPVVDIPTVEIPFTPPDNGFDWSVPSRFGNDTNFDGMIDYHWIVNDQVSYYDPTYVHPSEYRVNFDGCQTADEYESGQSTNTYRWRFLNPGEAEDAPGTVVQGNACRITKGFLTQDTYRVRLTIYRPNNGGVVLDSQGRGDPFMQNVVVKDYLIVSIGDSFASGEGNPDIPQRVMFMGNQWVSLSPPRWQDTRCHRSALAGPAQAALALERSDRRTSVTFISFACSGSTIDTPFWEMYGFDSPIQLLEPDPNKYVGVGVLRPYRGTNLPPGFPYTEARFIPAQIDQVIAAVEDRTIDALIISAGGNDIQFGNVAMTCLLFDNCWTETYIKEIPGGNSYRLDTVVNRAMTSLPSKYAAMAARINNLNVANVFITEYPDMTANENPNAANELDRYCSLLYDVLPWYMFKEVSRAEAKDARVKALDRLNGAVKTAAEKHGWIYVDGIADQFRVGPDGKGHGYCTKDSWIRNAAESEFMQGPLNNRKDTKGPLHPNARGHQVYAERLREEMFPRLNPTNPNTPPPAFTTSFTSGTSTSRQGENGWLTGRCVGTTCTSDLAVLKVVAQAQSAGTALRGTKVSINGVDGCSGVPGISCTTQLGTGLITHTWSFNISQNGVYRLQFQARDSNQQVSTFAYEVRVDLNNPLVSAIPMADVPGDAGWYRQPLPLMLTGSDVGDFSGLAEIEYHLNGVMNRVPPGTVITISDDGEYNLTFQAIDFAGRRSAVENMIIRIDQTPPTTTANLETGGSAYQPGQWTNQNIQVTLSAADNIGGSGVAQMNYIALGAHFIDITHEEGDTAEFTIIGEGETTIEFYATDEAGNSEPIQSRVLRIDRTPPTVACDSPNGQWHASDVSIACTASDSGAGFADGPSMAFSLVTDVPAGTETANAATNSRQVCDLAGNCVNVPMVTGIKVDKKAPDITVTAPTDTSYLLNEPVSSSYACADGGSGVASCSGPVASGSLIDTATTGVKAFQVSASDLAGNISTYTASYQVSYKLCLLYDQTKSYRKGSTVPIRLQLCDTGDVNQSAESIVISAQDLYKVDNTASSIVADAGNANPDNDFRYDGDIFGYVYNLSTKGLSTGTWAMTFSVSNDPRTHTIYFDLR